jgi:hypothetical protein
METVFRVKVSDLNVSFLKKIKTLFKDEGEVEIKIHPTSDDDQTAYLVSTENNRKLLEQSLQEAKAGKLKKLKLKKLK